MKGLAMHGSKALHFLWMLSLGLVLQGEARGHGGQYAPPYRGPLPAHTGGAGDVTVSPDGSANPISWEEWWARNRYRFLRFPDIRESAFTAYPFTRGAEDAGRMPDPLARVQAGSVDFIRPLLDHESFEVRGAAVIGLGMLDDRDSLKKVIGLLKDKNQWVKDAALLSMGFFQDPAAQHLLLHFARNTQIAAEALGQSSIPAYFQGFALAFLTLNDAPGTGALLKSVAVSQYLPDDVRAVALECIGLLEGEDCVPFLIEFSRKRQVEPQLAGIALTALSRINGAGVHDALSSQLRSRHIEIRRSAALGLSLQAEKGDQETVKALYRTYLHTGDDALRGFSLLSMGFIGGPEAVERLIRTVRMDVDKTCPWACLGLGFALRRDPDPRAEELLRRILCTHGQSSIRSAAAVALGLSARRQAVEPLLQTLEEGDDPYLRGHAAMALGMIRDESAVESLEAALHRDHPPQVRIQAAMALAFMDRNQAAPELIELLMRTTDPGQKNSAALGLSFMGDVHVLIRLLDTLKSEKDTLDAQTLSCCVLLLSKMASGRTVPRLEPFAANADLSNEFPMKKMLLSFGI